MDLLSLVGRTAGSAVGRLVGSKVSQTWNQKRLSRELEKVELTGAIREQQARLTKRLTPLQSKNLHNLLSSEEMAIAIQRVACAQFLTRNKKVQLEADIENHIFELTRLNLPDCDLTTVSAAGRFILMAIRQLVAAYIVESELCKQTSTKVLASLIPAASAHISAADRNGSLLSGLKDLGAIQTFVDLMRKQIVSVHGAMLLPHSQSSSRRVPLGRLFVEPQIVVGGRTLDLSSAIESAQRAVLLGDPGGGKSTVAQKVTLEIATAPVEPTRTATVPFMVVLRDFVRDFLANRRTLVQYLADMCKSPYNVTPPPGAIEYLMLNGHAHVVLDGLDELMDIGTRSQVVDFVHSFCSLYPDVPVLVTSRRIGYTEVPLDRSLFTSMILGPFDDKAVVAYTTNWFDFDDTTPDKDKVPLANAFLRESELVADLRTNPLMLALMCSIYSAENYIPRNLPDVYEKCSTMLFERWDKQRNIIVKLPFNAHVRTGLYALALWMHQGQNLQNGVGRAKIVRFMTDYLLGRRFESREDAEDAADKFVDFCTGRAWVLTDIGSDAKESKYGFTHRTFMEYFSARQITRDNPSAKALFEYLFPSIQRAENDVVAQIALQLLGANVTDAADDFLSLAIEWLRGRPIDDDRRRNVMSFIVRSLTFIVPRPAIAKDIAEEVYTLFSSGSAFDDSQQWRFEDAPKREAVASALRTQMYDLVCSATENLDIIGRTLHEQLGESFDDAKLDKRQLPDRLLMFVAYPRGFVRANKWAYSSISHDEYWASRTPEYRRLLTRYFGTQRPTTTWHYYYLHFTTSASYVEVSRLTLKRAFFGSNYPEGVAHPSLAHGLLAHLATDSPMRDDLDQIPTISAAKAGRLCTEILAMEGDWRQLAAGDQTELLSTDSVTRNEFWQDARLNSLYALLAAEQADYACAIGAISSNQRSMHWHALTGQLFAQLEVDNYPVTSPVIKFLHGWIQGRNRTVG